MVILKSTEKSNPDEMMLQKGWANQYTERIKNCMSLEIHYEKLKH